MSIVRHLPATPPPGAPAPVARLCLDGTETGLSVVVGGPVVHAADADGLTGIEFDGATALQTDAVDPTVQLDGDGTYEVIIRRDAGSWPLGCWAPGETLETNDLFDLHFGLTNFWFFCERGAGSDQWVDLGVAHGPGKQHLTLTWEVIDATTARYNLYLGSSLIAGPIVGARPQKAGSGNLQRLVIGGDYVLHSYFTGGLYSARVFDAALTPEQIAYSDAQINDGTAPYLAGQVPAPDAVGVSRTANVTVEVLDDDTGVDAATVEISVGGVLAWSGDAAQPGFAVTKTTIAGGFRYVINPAASFDWGEEVTVEVAAADLAGNDLAESYTFTAVDDVAAPYLENVSPAADSSDAARGTAITVDILDDGSGVDEAVTEILINGGAAWSAGSAQPGFTVATSVVPGGRRYVVQPDHPFAYAQTVDVRVSAVDLVGNPLDTDWYFVTEPPPAPTPPAATPTGRTITTNAGDTWDYLAYRAYGSERYMAQLIEANPAYNYVVRFGGGVVLAVPELDAVLPSSLPPWRSA